MVSLLWATIFASSGLLVYLAVPVIAGTLSAPVRKRVMDFEFGLAQRAFGQTAVVRRVLGGYDIMSFSIDDEQNIAQITLDSGLLGDDKTMPFKDPDNRIKRMSKKPLTVVPEGVPAAVDAEVCEVAHHAKQAALDDDYYVRAACDACGGSGVVKQGNCSDCAGSGQIVRVDPYVEMGSDWRFVDPIDVAPFVCKSVEPKWLDTVKTLTKKRFDLYDGGVGAAETMVTFLGFAVGLGGVMAMQYMETNVLRNSGNVTSEVLTVAVDIVGVLA